MSDSTSFKRVPVKVYGGRKDEYVWALVDEEDYPRVCKRKWGMSPKEGYAYRKDIAYREYDGTSYYVGVAMHRLLADAKDGEFVDHINGDRLDNRRSNLRICTRQQNLQNRMPSEVINGNTKQSRFKGVSKSVNKTNPWRATIGINGRSFYLGCFPTEEAAAAAYDEAAIAAFGEFAHVNGNRTCA